MALTVEDGSGVAEADSYLSVADADAYHAAHGNPTAWSDEDEAAKEAALRLATRYLDLRYGHQWKGRRVYEAQGLAWPRYSVFDYDGYQVGYESVPRQVEDAAAVLALRSLGEELMPDISNPGRVKRTLTEVGPITKEIEYQSGSSPIKRFSIIDAMVRQLIQSNNRVVRA